MPRGRSSKYLEAKRLLIARIREESSPGGTRFMSNREVARYCKLSYMTAQTLVDEICSEGLLERRSTAGTFIPGRPGGYELVNLIFDIKAKNPKTFGALLLQRLQKSLQEAGVRWKLSWGGMSTKISNNCYRVLWAPDNILTSKARELGTTKYKGLLLSSTPPTAAAASRLDSISIDFFSVGIKAGQVLLEKGCKHVAVVANPHGRRTWAEQCLRGLRSILPRVRIVHPRSWSSDASPEFLPAVLSRTYDGFFCCIQRHAVELFETCHEESLPVPFVVAFAPPPRVPEWQGVFITFSLDEMVENATRIIRNRFLGDDSPAVHMSIQPRVGSSSITT